MNINKHEAINFNSATQKSPAAKPRFAWLKKMGWLGFIFFTVKGLLWLTVPGVLILWDITP